METIIVGGFSVVEISRIAEATRGQTNGRVVLLVAPALADLSTRHQLLVSKRPSHLVPGKQHIGLVLRNLAASSSEIESRVRYKYPHIVNAMTKPFRLVLAALFAVAFAIGGMGNIASAKSTVFVSDGPCRMMTPMHASDSKPAIPCKTIKIDCANQAGCITIGALPMPEFAHQAYIQHAAVEYWLVLAQWADAAFVPDPLPPRTI